MVPDRHHLPVCHMPPGALLHALYFSARHPAPGVCAALHRPLAADCFRPLRTPAPGCPALFRSGPRSCHALHFRHIPPRCPALIPDRHCRPPHCICCRPKPQSRPVPAFLVFPALPQGPSPLPQIPMLPPYPRSDPAPAAVHESHFPESYHRRPRLPLHRQASARLQVRDRLLCVLYLISYRFLRSSQGWVCDFNSIKKQ